MMTTETKISNPRQSPCRCFARATIGRSPLLKKWRLFTLWPGEQIGGRTENEPEEHGVRWLMKSVTSCPLQHL